VHVGYSFFKQIKYFQSSCGVQYEKLPKQIVLTPSMSVTAYLLWRIFTETKEFGLTL
jgi:hypothetical protein